MAQLSKAARKQLALMANEGLSGRRGCDVDLRFAPALVRRRLAKIDMRSGMPFYVITEKGRLKLADPNAWKSN